MDKELTEKIKRIYEDYGKSIFRYLLSILYNRADAEDVLGNLFLKIVRHQKRIFRVRNLKSYLFAMARNEATDFIKTKIKNRELGDGMVEALFETQNESLSLEDREKISLALFNLPVEQREVITLKIWEGFTFREISRVLKVSPDTCASRYRYGLEKLRGKLRI